MSIINKLEEEIISRYPDKSDLIDKIKPGYMLSIKKLKSKSKKRKQSITGLCIALRKRGVSSSFTLRRSISGYTVDTTYFIYSPLITNIQVVGKVNSKRAKLYNLRNK